MRQALIAVGVFAALLVVVLATRDRGGNVNVGVPKLELPAFDPAQISAIELSGAQTVTLKKEASGWSVAGAEKVFHPADQAQVDGVRDALAGLKATDFVTDRTERFAELELDEAKGLQLKVFTGGAAPALEVVFGKAGKSGGTYLRAPKGKVVFLTQTSAVYSLRRDANAWRKRAFFPATAEQLAKLRVKLEDGATLELESKPDGSWALVTAAPAGFRFDPALARQLAAAVAGSSAIDFADQPGTEPLGAAVIEAELKDGKQVVMRLGAGEKVLARLDGDPQGYVISAEHAAQLKKRLADLRDTRLLSFDPEKALKLTIQAGGKKTVVAKQGGGWELVEPKKLPEGFEFDPDRVAGQLAGLGALRAARVEEVAEAKAGLGKPTATIELSLEGAPPQTVKFGGDLPPGQLYVKGSADALVYAIDAAQRTRWEAGPELFKKLPPPPPHQMQGLENLPPELRQQLEAQLRQRQQLPQ